MLKLAHFALSLVLGATLLVAGCGSKTPLTPPIVLSPSNGASSISVHTPFMWLSMNGVTYDFQLSTDSSFSNITEQKSGLKENSYILNNKLLPETQYYWRVRAKAFLKGTSSWTTSTFKTGLDVTAPPPPPPPRE